MICEEVLDMAAVSNTGKIFSIVQKNQHIVLIGGRLWIYRNNGRIVSCHRDIVNPHKVAFLSSNRLLVECGRLKAYILLSLEDRSEITRIAQPKMDISSNSFVISKDERYIYDWFELKGNRYLVRIDTLSWEKEICVLQYGLRVVSDMCCDNNGELCLLEHHYEEVGGRAFSCNGIRYAYRDEFVPGSAYFWKHKWSFSFPQISSFFLGDTETVLTNDLHIYKPATNEIYNLLERETEWERPLRAPSSIQLSEDGKFLVLCYPTMNVVVDMIDRKIIARYATDNSCGCLVNDKFWVYDESGVVKKPFPLIEQIPQCKYRFWKP